MTDNYSDGGWLKAIGEIADAQMQRRKNEVKEKATRMRAWFRQLIRMPGKNDVYVVWVQDAPWLTECAPDELLECDRSLAAIFDEWGRRVDWHTYWKDAFEFELERQKKEREE